MPAYQSQWTQLVINEKDSEVHWAVKIDLTGQSNPVVESAEFVHKKTNLVELNAEGIRNAARYIHQRLVTEKYTPCTWRSHPLHLCPPLNYSPHDTRTRSSLDWVFLISSLNFSFWSEREGCDDRYGVEWREGWGKEHRKVWTGYWSLVAAINRALEAGIPITDPAFYSSPALCPDSLIEDIFTPAPQCAEQMPMLSERIEIMREVGFILCASFRGSFQGVIDDFQKQFENKGTALQLVQMVTDIFPSFRDEAWLAGRRVSFWKRAQILVAETWAAFHPLPLASTSATPTPHPFFPSGIHQLTMFADYRVPQILHHLLIITYPPQLLRLLKEHVMVAPQSREELSIRAASVLAVEAVKDEIRCIEAEVCEGEEPLEGETISSVLIDFYLWDLAKRLERGEHTIDAVDTGEMVPAHRTRSIWY